MKMSDVKDKFLNKNFGHFTEEDVLSGNYSQQDVIDLLDGYDSLLAAFSKYSDSHARLEQENAELRQVLSLLCEPSFKYAEIVRNAPSLSCLSRKIKKDVEKAHKLLNK